MKKGEEGLFLTELLHTTRKEQTYRIEPLKTERTQRSERHEPQKSQKVAPQVANQVNGHLKLIQTINLSSFSATSYSASEPLAPGYGFYCWFAHQHAKLPCRMPDTILVEASSAVYYIYSQRNTTLCKRVLLDNSHDKETFISFAMERMLQIAISQHDQDIAAATVAIVKRPLSRKTIANTVETIAPLDLLALLLDIADGSTGPLLLQQYITPKSRHSTFCRLLWHTTTTAKGSISAYLLTSKVPTALGMLEEVCSDDTEVKSTKDMMKSFGKRRVSVSDRPALDEQEDSPPILPTRLTSLAEQTTGKNKEYLLNLVPCASMTPMERNSVHRQSAMTYKSLGHRNVCSLTEDGTVTEASASNITASKMTFRALNGLEKDIEQLINHIEIISRQHNRNVIFDEFACDFIRDNHDVWWLIQVKGFRLTDDSLLSLRQNIRQKSGDFDFDDDESSTDYLKNNKSEKFRLKLLNELGNKCKMCGVSFVEGATVASVQAENGTVSATRALTRQASDATYMTQPDAAAVEIDGDSKPAFGYHLTHRMAIKLAEIFRDNKFPLTSYVKEMLVQHALSTPINVSELRPHRPRSSGKRSTVTGVQCCYFCFEVYDQCCKCDYVADTLYKSLGVGGDAAPSAIDPTVMNRDTMTIQRIASAANELTLATSLVAKPTTTTPTTMSTHRMVHGKSEPWCNEHFEPDVVQWRIMIFVHALLDVRCPEYHSLHGNMACLSYSLGQQVQSMPFKNVATSGLADAAVVPVRQCRMHYVFASPQDATWLFAKKEIEFHLFFSPDSNFEGLDKTHLAWEGSFSVSLKKLKWVPNALGREKFDVLVPVKSVSLGKILVKMSVAIACNDSIPTALDGLPLYREERCFWPPTAYHDAQPLPEAWVAMMTPKHLVSGNTSLKRNTSQEESALQDSKLFIQQLQSHIVRRGFDRETPYADGTVDTAKILEIVLEDINNEIVYGEQQSTVNSEIVSGLKLIRTAVELMQEDEVMYPRLTWDAIMSKLDDYISHAATKEEAEERVAQLGPSAHQLELAKAAQVDREQQGIDIMPELTSRRTSTAHRRTRRTQQLTSVLNALRSPPKSGNSTPQRSARLDPLFDNQSRLVEYAVYASTTRRNRRLLFGLSIFELVSKQCEAMDVAELRQYLLEEREKLNNVMKMVHVGLMTLPSVAVSYEQTLSAKFSLLRSVICAHLLTSSSRLLQLYSDYTTNGVAIISQIAFVTSCEEMFRQISELTCVPTKPNDLQTLQLDETVVDLYYHSRKAYAAPVTSGPLYCRLLCDAHGVTDFYLADICCVKCEMEIYRPSDEKK